MALETVALQIGPVLTQTGYLRVRNRIGALLADLQESLAGARVIAAHNRRTVNLRHHRRVVGRHRDATVPDVPERPDAADLPPISGAIELRGVTFAYEPGRPAFVGETGSGKSTITRLITRFFDPDDGAVAIDGHDLRDVTLHSLRSQLGVVPQEPFLFAGRVRDNVAFARPRVLILDEATSNLDPNSETRVERALDAVLDGRTAIIIAHRLATARRADRIAVVDSGRIVEMGSHSELIGNRYAPKGCYAAMYESWVAHGGAP